MFESGLFKRHTVGAALVLAWVMMAAANVRAQSSSLSKRASGASGNATDPASAGGSSSTPGAASQPPYASEPQPRTHPALPHRSIIAVPPKPPKLYAVGDHITVIVREQLTFEADADSETKNDYSVTSELNAFPKPIDGGLGATGFARGKPNIDYSFKQDRKNEADVSSQNRLVTRLTAEIIDVKPNGNLVIFAKGRIQHGEEVSVITFTGTCSKKKLSADDSIISTDVADKEIKVHNEGTVRDGAKAGWLSRIIDFARPF